MRPGIKLTLREQRASGANLLFYVIEAQGASVQVVCQSNNHAGTKLFAEQHDLIHLGDIIEITGFPGRTNPRNRDVGELSVFARSVSSIVRSSYAFVRLKEHRTTD